MDQLNYEQAIDRLKRVVEQLERGSLGLEESLSLFEEGTRLTAHCEERLQGVEARVRVLVDRVSSAETAGHDDLDVAWIKKAELKGSDDA